MLPDHDVYTIKWEDPKDVPIANGSLDLDSYISYIVKFMEHIGEDAHVIAICQPGVPLTAALSYMEATDHPALPLSATLKGSPVDTNYNPTKANAMPRKLANDHGVDGAVQLLERTLLQRVPAPHAGKGQMVHNRFNQLGGFYALAPEDHIKARIEHWQNIAMGRNPEAVERHDTFYKGYDHVQNLPGPYLMDTNRRRVFTISDCQRNDGVYRP